MKTRPDSLRPCLAGLLLMIFLPPLPASAQTPYLVKDILIGPPGNDGSSAPEPLVPFGGSLAFAATDVAHGTELWKSDGTEAGTSLVQEVIPGSDPGISSALTSFASAGGTLFFIALDSNSPPYAYALWASDAGFTNTRRLKPIVYPSQPPRPATVAREPFWMTDVGGTLFFVTDDGVHGIELWKSDGTPEGTVMVKDIQPGDSSSSSFPAGLVELDGALYFAADDGTHGPELWKSDGTPEGTVMVQDIAPGGPGSLYYIGTGLLSFDGAVYFSADDGVHGQELWKSDGTSAGTVLVQDIQPGDLYSHSYPDRLTASGGTLYFRTDTDAYGQELWKSDGTPEGTALVKDIVPGASESDPASLTDVAGTLFFVAYEPSTGRELWKSDGTPEGTVLVKDVQPTSPAPYGAPSELTAAEGTLYFNGTSSEYGHELWKSDGTEAGTVLVADIRPGSAGSDPIHLTLVGRRLFFSAHDGVVGREPWAVVLPSVTPTPPATPPGPTATPTGPPETPTAAPTGPTSTPTGTPTGPTSTPTETPPPTLTPTVTPTFGAALCSRTDGCATFELMRADFAGGNAVDYAWRLTNTCASPLSRAAWRFLPGADVTSPAEGAAYTTAEHAYQVNLVAEAEQRGLDFVAADASPIAGGQSDVFEFTVTSAALTPDTILWNAAELADGAVGRMDIRQDLCYALPSAAAVLGSDAAGGWRLLPGLLALGLCLLLRRLRPSLDGRRAGEGLP